MVRILSLLVSGLALAALPATSQAQEGRVLNWAGKRADPARTAPAVPATAQAALSASAMPRATPTVYGAPFATPVAARPNSLTPASAWLPANRPAAPVFSNATATSPTPYAPSSTPTAEAPPTSAPALPAPAAAPVVQAEAPTPARPAADEAPRYYSVHRPAGRQPDPVPLPAPFFLDAAPVDMAEPAPPPTILRDSQGRIIPAQIDDGSNLP